MKLSTGKVAFPIEFDNGDKQTIYFNPNDPDLMIRMKNICWLAAVIILTEDRRISRCFGIWKGFGTRY
jgi:hypothetical protein